MSDPIRVLLIEDNARTRAALMAALLAGGFEVCGAFDCGERALEQLVSLAPDVALVDLELPGIDGVESIRRMRALSPGLPVLVLTVLAEEKPVMAALEAGACGYLLKDTPLAEVRRAIEKVKAGHAPLSPEVTRYLLARLRTPAPSESAKQLDLSHREREVLGLLALGHSYSSIAQALGIGLGTVQSHVKNLYRKLEISSKAEAACIAERHGMLPRRVN